MRTVIDGQRHNAARAPSVGVSGVSGRIADLPGSEIGGAGAGGDPLVDELEQANRSGIGDYTGFQ